MAYDTMQVVDGWDGPGPSAEDRARLAGPPPEDEADPPWREGEAFADYWPLQGPGECAYGELPDSLLGVCVVVMGAQQPGVADAVRVWRADGGRKGTDAELRDWMREAEAAARAWNLDHGIEPRWWA